MLLTIAVGTSMVVNNFSLILKQPPLIISLQTTATPITNFKFPAVAVCSNKVISRAALRNYTNYLYEYVFSLKMNKY